MKAVAKSSGLFLFWMFHAIALFLATTQGSKDARNGLGVAGGRNILSRRRHDATGVFSICSQRRRDAKGETDFRYNKEERLPAYIFFTNKITTGPTPGLRDTKQRAFARNPQTLIPPRENFLLLLLCLRIFQRRGISEPRGNIVHFFKYLAAFITNGNIHG